MLDRLARLILRHPARQLQDCYRKAISNAGVRPIDKYRAVGGRVLAFGVLAVLAGSDFFGMATATNVASQAAIKTLMAPFYPWPRENSAMAVPPFEIAVVLIDQNSIRRDPG